MAAFDYIELGHMYWNYWPFLDNSVHFMYVKKSYKFNKSEEQYKKQSPINTKSCTENQYVNEIQKVPGQNFGAYEGF